MDLSRSSFWPIKPGHVVISTQAVATCAQRCSGARASQTSKVRVGSQCGSTFGEWSSRPAATQTSK